MNELATRPSVTVALTINTIPDLQAFCAILANTDMVPKGYKGKPDDILVAILHGQELGLPHLQALQSIAVINGIPSIYGDAALSLVRAKGKLEDFDEWIEVDGVKQEGSFPILKWVDENKSIVAFCMSRRVGMPRPRTTSFSVDDAGRAGLWGKSGPWTTVPQRMLMWRARGWNLRDNFGDVLKGLAIAEETQDIQMERTSEGSYAVAQEDPNVARLAQVQAQLQEKTQDPASTPSTGVPPATQPPSSAVAESAGRGGPGPFVDDGQWTDICNMLDEDADRRRCKNKTKAALKIALQAPLESILPAKREAFILKLLEIAKAEEVSIVL